MTATSEPTLAPEALQDFLAMAQPAVEAVSERFAREAGETYGRFGEAGQQACRQDIRYTLDFLRPAIEFGLTEAFADYIVWLKSVLAARQIPAEHVSLMLAWLGDFYMVRLSPEAGLIIRHALETANDTPGWENAQVESISRHCPASWDGMNELKTLLLDGRRSDALQFLAQSLQDGASLIDIELHLLQPALYQIGLDWQQNLISVAQEHLATATATSVMTQLAATTEYAAPIGRRVLLACVAGNHHGVGLRIVGDGFETAGWEVHYLGTDVPTAALAEEIRRSAPDLVGLSVSMPYQFAEARRTMTALHSRLGDAMPAMMIGGLAINGFPRVTIQLGATLTAADAAAAVAVANGSFA